jgi:3-mercaptopropionate dioxygenase
VADSGTWLAQPSPTLRAFVDRAEQLRQEHNGPVEDLLAQLERPFRALLAEPGWLPPPFAAICETGGMGGNIGQWLLYRSANQDLVLFSLVVPHGSETPVHDHHAWGLVGLYRGEQAEMVYRRQTPEPGPDGAAPLALAETRTVRSGEIYRLLPPHADVHAVRTTSPEPSVSIHLLGIDAGCLWRHSFDPEHGTASPFRSGYTNQDCPPEPQPDLATIHCAPVHA